jgi:hypothetical protein
MNSLRAEGLGRTYPGGVEALRGEFRAEDNDGAVHEPHIVLRLQDRDLEVQLVG